jgi:hypothetical protein
MHVLWNNMASHRHSAAIASAIFITERNLILVASINYTGQQSLIFFVPRGKISNPDRPFNAEFKYVSSFSPSSTDFL